MKLVASIGRPTFMRAFFEGKPLRPKGDWTIGDLIYLAATVNSMLDALSLGVSESDFVETLYGLWSLFEGLDTFPTVDNLL